MSKHVKVYVPLDSLFDYRQGLICKILTDEADDLPTRLTKAADIWSSALLKPYSERTLEDYSYPKVGLTNEMFKKAYEERSVDDFVYYTPSNLTRVLAHMVVKQELEADQMVDIRSFVVTVNLFPYVLDDFLKDELRESLLERFNHNVELKFIYADDRLATPSFYRGFTHVFKYDILLGDYGKFINNLSIEPIPDVVFFVPDIFLKRQEYVTGKPMDVIEAFSYTVSNQIGIKPIMHRVYDHL